MTLIVFDIETIPGQDAWIKADIDKAVAKEIEGLSAPKSYKSQEAIDGWMSDKKQELLTEASEKFDKCALDGAFNHIICIGVAIDDAEPVTFTATTADDEKKIIEEFFSYVVDHVQAYKPSVFIGHNVQGFDLKIIKQRCMVLGIKAPSIIPFNAKPWEANPYDTMLQWDQKNFVSMDKIAKALGLPGKGVVSGSDVYPMWCAGEFEKIAAYCADDVQKTRSIYRRMVLLDLPPVKEIPAQGGIYAENPPEDFGEEICIDGIDMMPEAEAA